MKVLLQSKRGEGIKALRLWHCVKLKSTLPASCGRCNLRAASNHGIPNILVDYKHVVACRSSLARRSSRARCTCWCTAVSLLRHCSSRWGAAIIVLLYSPVKEMRWNQNLIISQIRSWLKSSLHLNRFFENVFIELAANQPDKCIYFVTLILSFVLRFASNWSIYLTCFNFFLIFFSDPPLLRDCSLCWGPMEHYCRSLHLTRPC